MKRSVLWGIGIGLTVLGMLVIAGMVVAFLSQSGSSLTSRWGGAVGLLELTGPIELADEFIKEIEEARKSAHIKAVVLRVNSPGGSVGASQEIFHALQRLRKEKPLVASFGNIAASGGYYIGLAAQQIFALPGTITASIGVRMSHVDAQGLFHWALLKPEVLKSGHFKDVGSPIRPMRDDERALLDGLLQTMHKQFKTAVAQSRQLEPTTVDHIADGRVMTGQEALEAKLIDNMGDLHDAVMAAGALAGLKGEPNVVRLAQEEPWWIEMFESYTQRMVQQVLHQVTASETVRIGYY